MRFGLLGSLVVASTCVGFVQCTGNSSGESESEGGESSGGAGPRGGSAGTSAGDAGSTQGGAGAVCQSTTEHVSTVPFTLSFGDEVGEGGGGGDGGGAGRAQGCTQIVGGAYPLSKCAGSVRRTQTEFIFDDGSVLTWTGTPDDLPLPETPAGAIPWVEYEEQYYVFCPFCGGYTRKAISILAREGGQVQYVGSTNGDPLEEPSVLFGVAIELEPKCYTAPYNFDCYTVVDHRFDVVMGTDPAQQIQYGERTRIDVPGGTFDIFWSNAVAAGTYNSGCFDGRSPMDTREFAAVRVFE